MPRSRPLQDLGCLTQATLFNVCLDREDLRALGVWGECPAGPGFSAEVWCRACLHKACRRDPESARRVSDRLDLQFLDTVVLVRCMDELEVDELVERWLSEPQGEALPPLLWALCTDARPAVHAAGARLCHEAVAVACRRLVDEPGAA